MLTHKSIQLELNFNGSQRNLFRERIQQGNFQVLAEVRTPFADTQLKDAVARYADFQYLTEISGRNGLPHAGLALIHEQKDSDSLDPVLFLSSLCKDNPDAHVLYLRGRDHTPESIYEEVRHAASLGIKNFCAVSGSTPEKASLSEVMRTDFLESVNILNMLKEKDDPELLTGATVNPFKYTPAETALQYFKAFKKVRNGASFLITQLGWDMMKLQEFRWQMWRRDLNIPMFARQLFLTPDRASDICAGKYPGIRISTDLAAELRREVQYSHQQFESAQIRRIQLHAAGAALLGFHGIQLAGVDTPEMFQILLKCIGEALQEFTSFENWKTAYKEYYSRLELAPYPHLFYLFENLLNQAQPPEKMEDLKLRKAEIPPCTQMEFLRYQLAGKLFGGANEVPPEERKLTKKLLLGCRSCKKCRIPETLYVCPENCPKGMVNGPCGCSKPDGTCEFSEQECEFHKRLRLADAIRDYSMLETAYIEHTPRQ